MTPGLVLAAPAGFAVGVALGLLGGGGSILTVPILVYGLGLPDKPAIATSQLIVGAVAVVGAVRHARHGGVDLRAGLVFGGFGTVGASLGSRIAAAPAVPGPLLLVGFAALMIVVAALMLRSGPAARAEDPSRPMRFARIALLGASTGLLTGTLGVGGGFLIVPALLYAGGLTIHRAIGTSLVAIALNCAAGFAGYAGRVPIDLRAVAAIAAFGAAGSVLGAHWSPRTPAPRLRRWFGWFVLVLGVIMLADQGARWLGGP